VADTRDTGTSSEDKAEAAARQSSSFRRHSSSSGKEKQLQDEQWEQLEEGV